MISSKYINKITIAILLIAMVFTLFITVYPRSTKVSANDSSTTYTTKFFDKNNITSINVEVTEENWNDLLENAIDEEYVPANITINGETFYNVGIRAKGNSSLSRIVKDDTTNRYSFKVKFNEYVKGQTLYGLEKLVLNNNYSDTTSMKEYLSYDLLSQMGVSTPAFAYTDLKINGDTFGLYLAVEVIEESFLERYYGSSEGNLYKPESMDMAAGNKLNNGNGNQTFPGNMPTDGNANGNMNLPSNMPTDGNANGTMNPPSNMPTDGNASNEVNGDMPVNGASEKANVANMPNNKGNIGGGQNMMNGSKGGANLVYVDDEVSNYSTVLDSAVFKSTTDEDKAKVIEMIKNLNTGTNLEEYLNVDEILRYFAVNTFLVNLDSYASNMKHNYYLYERNGIFEILPWDYNMSFGGFQSGDSSSVINFPIDSPVTDSLENSPLIGKLLEVDEYKELYHKYLAEIVQYINNGTFSTTVDSVDKLISSYVQNDPTAFYTYDEYKTSLKELHTFGIDRAKSINAQLDGSQPSTSYGTLETTLNLSALGSMGGGFNQNKDKNINNLPTRSNNSTN